MHALRVVVAGFGPIYRSGLFATLPRGAGADISVVGQAGDMARAVAQIRLLHPDCIVTDMSFPKPDPASLNLLRAAHPSATLVVLSDSTDELSIRRAFQNGASSYILRPIEIGDLQKLLHAARAGERYLDPRLKDVMMPMAVEDDHALSQRESEVLHLLGLGYTNGEVAEHLVLSVRTVETHRSNIQRKLGIKTRAELARAALERGIASLPDSDQATYA